MSELRTVLRRSLAAVTLTTVAMLAACGQTGPLTLPGQNEPATEPTDGNDTENSDEDEDER